MNQIFIQFFEFITRDYDLKITFTYLSFFYRFRCLFFQNYLNHSTEMIPILKISNK